MTEGCAGDAVAVALSKKAPQAVVVKNFEPSKVHNTHRPRLATAEQNRPDKGIVNATLGLGLDNPAPGPSLNHLTLEIQ